MSYPSENVLWVNTLIPTEKNEFQCSICMDDTSFTSWQDHISDTTHRATLEHFNLTFERRGQSVRCKLCDKDFDWSSIRCHGKSHNIALWQKADDKYQQFFENHIVEFKNKLYCCHCDAIFLHSSNALLHCQCDKTHQKLREKAAPLCELLITIPAGETYKSLVSEGFVPRDDTRLECKFCKHDSIEFHRITEHVKGFSHGHYKLQFEPKSNKPNELSTEVVTKNLQSMELTVSSSDNFPCWYFEKFNESIFLCKLCTCFVQAFEESIELHIRGKAHTDSLKKYGCDNISLKDCEIYYCSCCNVSIPDLKCLHIHIKNKSHMTSMLLPNKLKSVTNIKSTDKTETQAISTAVSVVRENIPCNYIVKINAAVSYCQVCSMKLSDRTSIANHAEGSSHKTALEKYGCDGVSLKEGNDYWCKYCHCRILGCDNVYLHIKGKRHTISLTAARKLQQEEKDKKNVDEAKSERPEWSKALSLMMNELTKLSELLKSKTNAEKPRENRAVSNQLVNVIKEQMPCSFCSAVVTSGVELHSHMAGHFTMEFVHSRVDKNTNNRNESYLEEVGVEEKNIAESVKILPVNIGEIKAPTVFYKHEENNSQSDEKSSDSNVNCFSRKSFSSKTSSISSDDTSNSNNEYSSNDGFLEKCRLPKKTMMQKIIKLLDFDKDYIYDMKDKLRVIELGMKLCMVVDAKSIYCLICRKTVENTLQNYFEHLGSLDHNEYLEGMEKDHALFEIVPGQFSELDLAYQYIEETSAELLQCLICVEEVADVDYALQDHIEETNHRKIRDQMHNNAKENFEDIRSRMQCDWYNVQKYWCVPCSANFETEVNFVKHLEGKKHANVMKKCENLNRAMMYDFCSPCALLWYGYRCTYAYHCDVPSHKWLLRDGHYLQQGLPELAANLLATPEQFVDNTINYLDSVADKEREKEKYLIEDLMNAVKSKFVRAKAYIYGSRASGLGSSDSDIDVFLDCGNRYDGSSTSERILMNLMASVHNCLTKDSQSWDVNELLTECRSPVIRANHRATGLSCDISLENGLSVENTKLVKSFIEIFPPCRKLILFLKQWMAFCNLSGSDRISSYALCWYVIFYMQKESILPSIATLIAMNKKSHVIAGWEVGVTHEFSYNQAESNYSLKEFLIRFFTFYANFDFRYDVACPLLGEVVKKRTFAEHKGLPKEMAAYVAYIENSDDPEPLRIDSPMCIQDPFDLQHNITKAVSKVFLCRFRTCCSKSLDFLCT